MLVSPTAMRDSNRDTQPSQRLPLLERPDLKPEERKRIGRAAVTLLGWGLVASTLLGLLALWHLVRRGRILRENLAAPKVVSLIDEKADELPPHPPQE